jgi:hypothetical protein
MLMLDLKRPRLAPEALKVDVCGELRAEELERVARSGWRRPRSTCA